MTALAELQLKDGCEIRMILHLEQVEMDKFSQLDFRAFLLTQLAVELSNKPLNLLLEDTYEEVIFVFEVKIDGAGCYPSLSGDIGNGSLVISMLSKGRYSRIHNPVAFVVGLFAPAHKQLPWPAFS
jgi:hypothetical protein